MKDLAQKLSSSQKRVRRSALAPLAAMDTLEAWALVVGALGDSAGEVADGAQLLLGQLDSVAELELLLGKPGLRSKSAWVRRRALEVLGRVSTPVPAKALLAGLKDREGEVRRMAAWSLERLAGEGRLNLHWDARARRNLGTKLRAAGASDRDLRVRGRALAALARLDPRLAAELHPTFFRSRDLGQRCVALLLAVRLLPAGQALRMLDEAARGEERLLRGQAQESLLDLGTKPAVAALIESLAQEDDPRLLFLLVRNLQRMSGRKHRADPRPWRAWLSKQPDDWQLGDSVGVGGQERVKARADSSSALSFSGLPLRSQRLCFLIDFSGSMWTPGADGRTAKQMVGEQLAQALESLPKEARFNLIPYTGKPHPWSDSLRPASKRNIQRALSFFADCEKRGSGNFWAAAMLALEDPEVDTLVVLSDGAPSGGQRYELELIVSHFQELNMTRRVALDSVLVDASWRLKGYWSRLAQDSGGESISVLFP